MTKDEELAKLEAIRANLRRIGEEPWISDAAIATFNKRQLQAALRIEEEELLIATRKMTQP